MDNLANKGIESDQPKPGLAKRRGRKGKKNFGIQRRYLAVSGYWSKRFGWDKWHSHGWYTTAARRDEALKVLQRQAKLALRGTFEYRPVDR